MVTHAGTFFFLSPADTWFLRAGVGRSRLAVSGASNPSRLLVLWPVIRFTESSRAGSACSQHGITDSFDLQNLLQEVVPLTTASCARCPHQIISGVLPATHHCSSRSSSHFMHPESVELFALFVQLGKAPACRKNRYVVTYPHQSGTNWHVQL